MCQVFFSFIFYVAFKIKILNFLKKERRTRYLDELGHCALIRNSFCALISCASAADLINALIQLKECSSRRRALSFDSNFLMKIAEWAILNHNSCQKDIGKIMLVHTIIFWNILMIQNGSYSCL